MLQLTAGRNELVPLLEGSNSLLSENNARAQFSETHDSGLLTLPTLLFTVETM